MLCQAILRNIALSAGLTMAAEGSTQTIFSAVAPGARSVVAGGTATAFAIIVNGSDREAEGCGISPSDMPLAADLYYQTTDPEDNTPVGAPNTPVDIPPGGAQTFLIALTAPLPMSETEVRLEFDCNNTFPASYYPGVNSLRLSVASEPVADLIAASATADGNGIVNIDGTFGTAMFAASAKNLGAGDTITVAPDFGDFHLLPLAADVCETDSQSGQCLDSFQPSLTTAFEPGAVKTFSVRVTGFGVVENNPGYNRIFLDFRDPEGALRGLTTVAAATLAIEIAQVTLTDSDGQYPYSPRNFVTHLEVTTAGRFRFDLTSPDFSGYLYLLDKDGRIVSEGPRLEVNLTTGDYHLVAATYYPGHSGTYRLSAYHLLSGSTFASDGEINQCLIDCFAANPGPEVVAACFPNHCPD